MTGFTPEEWRTAARVARRSIFTEGNPDLADAWEKAAYQAEARLIPPGGMALTAEQVEDVRIVTTEEVGGYTGEQFRRWHAAKDRLVESLFPATEPAEVISRYQTMQRGFAAKHFGFPANPVFEDRYTAPDGGKWQWTDELQWELRCYPPAPAEPAEEETKAETDGERDALAMWLTGYGIPDLLAEGIATALLNDYQLKDTASLPVVPAPTETGPQTLEGPWDRIEDIPKTVGRVTDRDGDAWEWDGDNWVTPETAILPTTYINRKYAPFVAAKEG